MRNGKSAQRKPNWTMSSLLMRPSNDRKGFLNMTPNNPKPSIARQHHQLRMHYLEGIGNCSLGASEIHSMVAAICLELNGLLRAVNTWPCAERMEGDRRL